MAIGADGTIAVDNYGDLVTSPYTFGRYELDGDVIVFVGGCGQDLPRREIPEDGRLHTVIAEPGIEVGDGHPRRAECPRIVSRERSPRRRPSTRR